MIIESLLDTDLYKFTMMQCVLHQFPDANVRYRFRCRTEGVDLSPYVADIQAEIDHLCTLTMSEQELAYLASLRFIQSDFVEFLSLFHLKSKYVKVMKCDEMPCGIDIVIEGPWLHTILFEIPVLAIVNEVYFRHTVPHPDEAEGMARLEQKIRWIKNEPDNGNLKISDFGTRRRFSREWQRKVIEVLCRELGIPIGTMAHEYLQACQGLGPRLRDSQTYGFEMWAKEYRGDLGIALSDVYGTEPFLRDFDMFFCKLFDGVRHDSGDPERWGERMILHYVANKCDPRSKTLIFSDALTIPKVIQLYRRFNHRIRLGFGIGTNLMNDLGPEPLNIVVKMVRANGQPVAKISDTPGKGMCEDETYLAYLRQVFGIDPGAPAGAAKP